jgi:hypothetical protein
MTHHCLDCGHTWGGPTTLNVPDRTTTSSDDATLADHRAGWDWVGELLRRGWHMQRQHGQDTYWVRPGKDPRAGHSAVLHGADGPFVVFTTAIDPAWRQAGVITRDGSGYAFSPFAFHAATEHGGDRSAAYKALSDAQRAVIAPSGPDEAPEGDEGVGDEGKYDADLLAMLIDWAEFFDADHQTEEWLWEPVIPAKRGTVLFAKGGTGKSLVILRIVVDLARRGVDVLYLDYEMTPADLDDRLAEMGVAGAHELEHLHYAQLPSLDPFDTPEGGRAVRRFAELCDAQLVVIDTFARAVQGEENDSDTVREFYRMTGMHLKADGRGFVRVDHSGKDESKGQRGSSAKNDDVDLVWNLKVSDDGYTLVRGKCRMGWVPERVNLERHDNPFTLAVRGGATYIAGTSECAALLDELGVALDAGDRVASQALRDHGGEMPSRRVIRDAVKFRRAEMGRISNAVIHSPESGGWVTAESATGAPHSQRRTKNENGAAHPAAHPAAESAKPLVDACAAPETAQAAHPPSDTAAQCANNKLAQCDSPSPDVDESRLPDDFQDPY